MSQNTGATDYSKVASGDVETAAMPAVAATPMVEVVAPSTLPEGYKFEAEIDKNTVISVVVPPGGVAEGQRFMVPAVAPARAVEDRSNIPVGQWKDGLCNCCEYGPGHPQLCLTIWCHLLAAGQIMQRMRLNWYGVPGSVAETAGTFKKVVVIFVVTIALSVMFSFLEIISLGAPVSYDAYGNPVYEISGPYLFFRFLNKILSLGLFVYLLIAVMNTRNYIRRKYAIPERDCNGCEDFCCALWCQCCTITQMARHTADYDTYAAACCTENGLPPHVPNPVE